MARIYPFTQALKIVTGDVRYPKWKVIDIHGETSFSLAATTNWKVITAAGSTVDSGTATVNNSDTDSNGNTVKTVQVTFDASNSALWEDGDYGLQIQLVLTSGEKDTHIWPVRVFTPGLD